MMVSAHRFRSIGWIALLLICFALVMVLAFRVNALRSQVHRTEQQIVSLRKEKLYLETEVETRANQQQLKLWNDVEFGYIAPTASQYLSNERQLAAFSKPNELDAPTPIRVASADDSVAAEAVFPSIASRLAGDPDISADAEDRPATEKPAATESDHAAAAAGLGAKLATVGTAKKSSSAAGSGKTSSKAGSKTDKAALARSSSSHSRDDHAAKPGLTGKSAQSAKSSTPSKAAKAAKPGKTAQ